MKVALAGLGGVGRQVVSLLLERQQSWQRSYGVTFHLVAVADINGAASSQSGFAPHQLQQLAAGDTGLLQESDTVQTLLGSGAQLLIDATPTNLETGLPGLPLVREALHRRMHAVLLSKGPLLIALPELRQLARQGGVGLKYSGATGAALPTLDTAEYSLMGAGLTSFSGIFNGTTNFILSWMLETGGDYPEALSLAQSRGIAERNPSLDVGGWDTAVKTCILANSLFESSLTLADVKVEGIEGVTPRCVAQAAQANCTLKLVGEATRSEQGVCASVGLRQLPAKDWLSQVNGTTKAIRYCTETMGELLVVGGASDPVAAAAAAWKDALQLALGR